MIRIPYYDNNKIEINKNQAVASSISTSFGSIAGILAFLPLFLLTRKKTTPQIISKATNTPIIIPAIDPPDIGGFSFSMQTTRSILSALKRDLAVYPLAQLVHIFSLPAIMHVAQLA